ncbi:V/A-type H+-transporting ATPase subunit I [Methanofollis sp. W23]|uniref:V-type ATP synthase subunit I n=1 Tax=Methanofollis sp. W23 TaxID=2817849 RepID=UPI001AE53650|nr:V-type ATP synthase subunit I [Methanofollis sp. W23]MBP2146343.1 V/A-type H+-transporting ATPase subunit I [Methanofollis sp. W23]
MFQPKRMSRILIAGSKDQMDTIVRELYHQHAFHIEDFVEKEDEAYEGFKIGMPLDQASDASSELIKIRSLENTFGISPDSVDATKTQASTELKAGVDRTLAALVEDAEDLTAQRSKVEAQVKTLEARVTALEPFAPVPLDMDLYHGYENVTVFAGYVESDVEIPVPHEKHFVPGGKGVQNFIVVFVPASEAEAADRALLEAHFQSVPIPDGSGPVKDLIYDAKGKISQLNEQIEKIERTLEEKKNEYGEVLVAYDEYFTAVVEQAEAPLRFATTDDAFVAEGWVPSEKVEGIIASLTHVTAGKVYVTELEVGDDAKDVPVEYNNPRFSHPTELLIDVYARPRYDEFDPTLLVSIVFPIFFGLILGDIGYGLVLLALSFGLRRYFKGEAGTQLLDTLRNSSIMSCIFGVLFSECFGFSLPWQAIIFSRHLNIGANTVHHPMVAELLIISVWIGILHITLGRLLHVWNIRHAMHQSPKATKEVLEQFGWLFTMWGIIIAVWSLFPIPLMLDLTGFAPVAMGLNTAGIFGAVLVLLGIVLIGQESPLELMEVPTIVSHVLSYTRLVAVGLSSVAIAMVTNYIALDLIIGPQLESLTIVGVVIVLIGLVVLLLGHVLNTALGLLGGGLNSIRLHYVEFFTKFYNGGGKKYVPFGMRRKFTEE